MIKKLKKILDNIEYAKSEVYSASEGIPDYECNASGREYISQAESYLFDAEWDLKEVMGRLEEILKEFDK